MYAAVQPGNCYLGIVVACRGFLNGILQFAIPLRDSGHIHTYGESLHFAKFLCLDAPEVAKPTRRCLHPHTVHTPTTGTGGARRNAQVFLAIQKEFGSFDAYVWRFVDGKPLQGRRRTLADVPARSAESDALSKDLKKRGMTFVGSTIMYAYMQAVGMVNDHIAACHCAGRSV